MYKDDLIEYSILRPFHTGLKVDVFVDSGGAYLRNHHEPVLFVRDGYEGEQSFIPVVLSNTPFIPESYSFKKIVKDDIESVFVFIAANLSGLMDLANDESSITKFTSSIQKESFQEKLKRRGAITIDEFESLLKRKIIERGKG